MEKDSPREPLSGHSKQKKSRSGTTACPDAVASVSSAESAGPLILVSYARDDVDHAKQIVKALRSAGKNVWTDYEQISVGDNIVTRMGEGIREAQFILLLSSEASKKSGWVEAEWTVIYNEQLDRGDVRVLPVKLDASELPTMLKPCYYADWYKDPELAIGDILEAIERHGQRNKEKGGARGVPTHAVGVQPPSDSTADRSSLGGEAFANPAESFPGFDHCSLRENDASPSIQPVARVSSEPTDNRVPTGSSAAARSSKLRKNGGQMTAPDSIRGAEVSPSSPNNSRRQRFLYALAATAVVAVLAILNTIESRHGQFRLPFSAGNAAVDGAVKEAAPAPGVGDEQALASEQNDRQAKEQTAVQSPAEGARAAQSPAPGTVQAHGGTGSTRQPGGGVEVNSPVGHGHSSPLRVVSQPPKRSANGVIQPTPTPISVASLPPGPTNDNEFKSLKGSLRRPVGRSGVSIKAVSEGDSSYCRFSLRPWTSSLVTAAAPGRVQSIDSFEQNSGGSDPEVCVHIEHAPSYTSRVCGLGRPSVMIKPGDSVAAGEDLGHAGARRTVTFKLFYRWAGGSGGGARHEVPLDANAWLAHCGVRGKE